MPKREALIVTVVLVENNKLYARALGVAIEQLLAKDGQEGVVNVSLVRLPE